MVRFPDRYRIEVYRVQPFPKIEAETCGAEQEVFE